MRLGTGPPVIVSPCIFPHDCSPCTRAFLKLTGWQEAGAALHQELLCILIQKTIRLQSQCLPSRQTAYSEELTTSGCKLLRLTVKSTNTR